MKKLLALIIGLSLLLAPVVQAGFFSDLSDWIKGGERLGFGFEQIELFKKVGNDIIPRDPSWDLNMGTSTVELGNIQFSTTTGNPPHSEGLLFYDNSNNTLGLYNNISDVTLQIGQEQWKRVINNSGSEILNGSVVRISGATSSLPTIQLAKADSPLTANQLIGFATHDIGDGENGIATTFGKVRDIDTSMGSDGQEIYLSADTAGEWTITRPIYPNYVLQLGNIDLSNATTGELSVNVVGRVEDIIENYSNGAFLEPIDFTITASSTAQTITGNLERTGGGNLTMNFSDGFTVLDTTPATTTALTAGSDSSPQLQYVYIPKSTKDITVSTSDWPSEEHIRISTVVLRNATTTATDGALGNRNWNDHIAGTDQQGHVQHIGARLRQESASWGSGVAPSSSIISASSPDDVYLASTSGMVWQLHLQSFPALDMETGDDIHVVNDFVDPYETITNLNSETSDSTGSTLTNRSFSFVMWGVQNKTGETSHLMLNLPDCSYTSSATAIIDSLKCSVFTIPEAFRGTGFLIARYTFSLSASGGGTWTLQDTEDLRGQLPSTVAGGGTGTAITEFADGSFSIFNTADNTKKINFDASNITTATTRTYTMPDLDGTVMLNLVEDTTPQLGGNLDAQSNTITSVLDIKSDIAGNPDYIDNDGSIHYFKSPDTLILQSNTASSTKAISLTTAGDLNMTEGAIDNVGDITHDDATASDFTIRNEDQDKFTRFFGSDGGVDTEILTLDHGGNMIGMGTTTPTAVLHIVRDGAANFFLERTGNATASLSAGFSSGFFGTRTEHPLEIHTGSSISTRIFIDDDAGNGNVGIGTTSPGAQLQVQGNASTTAIANFVTDTGGDPFYMTRTSGLDQSAKIWVDDGYVNIESIQDENSGDSGGFRLRIDDDGTASPFFDFETKSGTDVFSIGADGLVQVPNGGFRADILTSDPCGGSNYPEGSMFYNDTSDYYCFCNGAGADVQMHSPATACF